MSPDSLLGVGASTSGVKAFRKNVHMSVLRCQMPSVSLPEDGSLRSVMQFKKYPTFLGNQKGVSGEKLLFLPLLHLTVFFKDSNSWRLLHFAYSCHSFLSASPAFCHFWCKWSDGRTAILEPFLGAFAKLRKSTINLVVFCLYICLSLRVEQLDSSVRIFLKLYIGDFLENVSRKFNFH